MLSVKKTTALASVALLASLGLAGCSGETAPANNTSAPAEQAPEAPANEPLTADNFVQRISDAQMEAGSMHLSMDTNMQGQSAKIDGDALVGDSLKDMQMHMTISMGDQGSMEMIMMGTKIYMNMGDFTQNKFVQVPESELDAANLAEVESQMNPSSQFEAYKEALKSFEAEPGENIDGVDTTKYVLELDTKKLLESTSQESQLTDDALDSLGDTVSYDMYVGDDDLPRRMVMNLGEGTQTINFSKWGEPVKIEAPSADQITELPGT